jgi:hypothetical protein
MSAAAGSTSAETEMVTIPAARLAELEAAVDSLRSKLAKRVHNDSERLKAYNTAHPDKARERSRQYREAHREEYNARRRELRRLKKEAAAAAETGHA